MLSFGVECQPGFKFQSPLNNIGNFNTSNCEKSVHIHITYTVCHLISSDLTTSELNWTRPLQFSRAEMSRDETSYDVNVPA